MLFLYLIIINVVTFGAFAVDKGKAIKGAWRIPEAQLLFLCLIGGALGGLIGMNVCHHKTRKPKFKYLVPLMLVLQVILYFMI